MNKKEKTGFFHMFVGLVGAYMSLAVGNIVGISLLLIATANVLYACSLLLGRSIPD
jgi:hypothetical protein